MFLRATSRLTIAISLVAVSGCGPTEKAATSELTQSQKVDAIAATLQACSYDGRPVEAPPSALAGEAPRDCAVAVKRVMDFTGLPANFVVVSGRVDNAAAVILLDQNRTPRRVIAFNPGFMRAAADKVGGSPWGPMSIMAHEIAHHLSGHTIVPGGSRPEIELEADKFSGYVLYKMGAPLDDATRMILTVGNSHATATHPAKDQRADAIRQGWTESCRQAGGTGCGSVGQPAPQPSAQPAVFVTSNLPAPGSVPFKYGHFVIDETGKLDPARARAIDEKLYALARDVGAEFAILVVNDLHGLSANDYAWAMMRQLRIGKLDVGNGAVVVVAPRQRQAAVAFGPGFAKEAEFSTPQRQLLQWVDAAWDYCDDADGCKGWTDNLANIFSFTLNNAAHTKWNIEYQALGDLLSHYTAVDDERARTRRPFNDETDQPLGTLLRISGKITSLSAPVGIFGANESIVSGPLGYRAVSMFTDDGYPIVLYVAPRLRELMPSGELQAGQRYTAVGRLQKRGDKQKEASAMWLFSYDQL